MAYTKTQWTNGDVITAEKLNKIEDGIEDASASGGADWDAKEGESGYIANKPFETFIEKIINEGDATFRYGTWVEDENTFGEEGWYTLVGEFTLQNSIELPENYNHQIKIGDYVNSEIMFNPRYRAFNHWEDTLRVTGNNAILNTIQFLPDEQESYEETITEHITFTSTKTTHKKIDPIYQNQVEWNKYDPDETSALAIKNQPFGKFFSAPTTLSFELTLNKIESSNYEYVCNTDLEFNVIPSNNVAFKFIIDNKESELIDFESNPDMISMFNTYIGDNYIEYQNENFVLSSYSETDLGDSITITLVVNIYNISIIRIDQKYLPGIYYEFNFNSQSNGTFYCNVQENDHTYRFTPTTLDFLKYITHLESSGSYLVGYIFNLVRKANDTYRYVAYLPNSTDSHITVSEFTITVTDYSTSDGYTISYPTEYTIGGNS